MGVNMGRFFTARPWSGNVLLETGFVAKISVIFAFLYAYTTYITPNHTLKGLIFTTQCLLMASYKAKLFALDKLTCSIFDICGSTMTSQMDLGFGDEKPKVVNSPKVKRSKGKKMD